jgi:hypothetical protein
MRLIAFPLKTGGCRLQSKAGILLAMSIGHYVTCPKAHPLKVIYDPEADVYGFTCDECDVHSVRGFCFHTEAVLEVKVVAHGLPKAYKKQ